VAAWRRQFAEEGHLIHKQTTFPSRHLIIYPLSYFVITSTRIPLHETCSETINARDILRHRLAYFWIFLTYIRDIKNSLYIFLAEEETTTVTISEITDSEQTKTQSNGDTGELQFCNRRLIARDRVWFRVLYWTMRSFVYEYGARDLRKDLFFFVKSLNPRFDEM